MTTYHAIKRYCVTGITLVFGFYITIAKADEGFMLEAEVGASWQAKNDVQIPNDMTGDRFDLQELAGAGPWSSLRLNANWNINERHGMRLVLAPLAYEETGNLDSDVRFADANFSADAPVTASYTFNSWRIGYRYRYYDENGWRLWVGGTAKVRDAEIKLEQGATRANDDNVGFVPLLYLAGEYNFGQGWRFAFDFDGLAGGPGRAFDVSLKVTRDLGEHWRLGLGYRGLEGGADTDDVYNFAWFNTGMATFQYRF